LPFEHDDCGLEGSPCDCNPKGAAQWQKIFADVATPATNGGEGEQA
jgi:hypothetical protein